jgi:A/G-specific adenine glycosylase
MARKHNNISRPLFAWYRLKKRDFVWRSTTDPYVILISEVMLQQTQASRVQERLPLFLKQFPTVASLARSSAADVIRAWRGLGYNNRAVRLRELARSVVTDFHGRIPRTVDQLLELPGIGPYTANAVACFAFGQRVGVVDVNVRRVLSRMSKRMHSQTGLLPEKEIDRIAEALLPTDSYTWNQALMELGATVCTARSPKCDICPLRIKCPSRDFAVHPPVIASRSGKHRARPEPAHCGIPNRLWRGKVVQAVANLGEGEHLTLSSLGAAIKHDFRPDEMGWLAGLSRQLERDGILEISGRATRLRVRLTGS